MKYFRSLLLISALCLSFSSYTQTEEEFNELWGSFENYYSYCLEQLDSDDIDYLLYHARDDSYIYFKITLDDNVIVLRIPKEDICGNND